MTNTLLRPKVGIIGGAGPMAGALLFQKIIRICQEEYGCRNDEDFPYIMLLNFPFADMLSEGGSLSQGSLIKDQLKDCILRLQENEIEIAAIACNTLHESLNGIELKDISLIHMIEETALFLDSIQLFSTVVLCSNTSFECRLHQRYFDCTYSDENLHAQAQDVINKILAGKQCSDDSKMLADQLNSKLLLLGKEKEKKIGLVLGCTEFSVLNDQFPLRLNGLSENFFIIDPNQIVAEKICKLIFKNNN